MYNIIDTESGYKIDLFFAGKDDDNIYLFCYIIIYEKIFQIKSFNDSLYCYWNDCIIGISF